MVAGANILRWSVLRHFAGSIRGRLFFLALISIAPFATFSYLSVKDLAAQYRAESFKVAADHARATGTRIEHFIEGASQFLDALGVLAMSEPNLSIANNSRLQELKSKLPSYINSLQVIDLTAISKSPRARRARRSRRILLPIENILKKPWRNTRLDSAKR